MNKTVKTESNRKRNRRRLAFCCMMVAAALGIFAFLHTGDVHAEGTDDNTAAADDSKGVEGGAFEVTGYRLSAEVGKDHSYDVEETISVNIPDRLQSIEFAIPSGNFRISNITVEGASYEAKTASEASTVSIVDPEKLGKGKHKYTIHYLIQEYQDRDSSKDIFYFNVLLPEWKQPIGRVDIYVSFPEDFPWDDMQCYAGQFGVQDVEHKISFGAKKSARTVTVTGNLIPENFGITLKAQLPDGYWEGALNGSWAFSAILLSLLIAALLTAVMWLIGGRDPKVRREAVNRPLKELSPVELGYVFNSRVGISDVMLMIIDFAKKGYLTISEYEPKRYRLVKKKDPADEEKMYRTAYSTLFEGVYKGRAVDMSELGERLERIRAEITDDVAAGFASAESLAFTPLSRAFRYAGAVLLGAGLGAANAFSYCYRYLTPGYVESVIIAASTAVISLMLCREIDRRDSSSVSAGRMAELTSGFMLAIPVLYTAYRTFMNTGNALIPLAVVSLSAASVFFIIIMRARGKTNAELVAKLRSLRNFICHPEAKALLENYIADKDYYYDMLIYALAFGAEESWAISFLTLDVPEPEWYSDDIEGHAFSNLRGGRTTIDVAGDLRSFERIIENAYNDMQRHAQTR